MAVQPADLKGKTDGLFALALSKLEKEIDSDLTDRWTGGKLLFRLKLGALADDMLEALRKLYHGWVLTPKADHGGDYSTYSLEFKPKS